MYRLYILAGVVAVVAMGYFHYQSLLDENTDLKLEVQAKNGVIASKTAEIFSLTLQAETRNIRTEKLNSDLAEAREDVAAVADAFSKLNLEKEADKRPEVLQRAMRIGTIRAYRLLEEASRQ